MCVNSEKPPEDRTFAIRGRKVSPGPLWRDCSCCTSAFVQHNASLHATFPLPLKLRPAFCPSPPEIFISDCRWTCECTSNTLHVPLLFMLGKPSELAICLSLDRAWHVFFYLHLIALCESVCECGLWTLEFSWLFWIYLFSLGSSGAICGSDLPEHVMRAEYCYQRILKAQQRAS